MVHGALYDSLGTTSSTNARMAMPGPMTWSGYVGGNGDTFPAAVVVAIIYIGLFVWRATLPRWTKSAAFANDQQPVILVPKAARRLVPSRDTAGVEGAITGPPLRATQYGADPSASAFSLHAGASSSQAMACREHLEARAAPVGCHPRFSAEGHHRVGEVDRIPALSALRLCDFSSAV
jgi:hypothetical protein